MSYQLVEHPERIYHASPRGDLEAIGLVPSSPPVNVAGGCDYIYMGTMGYLAGQYFAYTQSGLYHIYEITSDGRVVEELPTGGQWRTSEAVSPSHLKKVGTHFVPPRSQSA